MAQRTIIITGVNLISEGNRKDGKGQWKLHGLTATDENGNAIDEKLKSFDELPLNTPVKVEIEKQESEQYGLSYMVKRPSMHVRLDDIEARVSALEGNKPKSEDEAPVVEDDVEKGDNLEDIPF